MLTHGRALLADNPNTTVVQGDLTEPRGILNHPEVQERIDFNRPVAVLMLAILHFIPGHDQAERIVMDLRARLGVVGRVR